MSDLQSSKILVNFILVKANLVSGVLNPQVIEGGNEQISDYNELALVLLINS